jgi:NAD(P)H-nitrite reductase large subunit
LYEHIAGFRLAGDTSSAGVYLSLMNRNENVAAVKAHLLEPSLGMGYVEQMAALPMYSA